MRLTAYVLLGDPAWLRASVLSYYPHVSRIVASYDETNTGWTGEPLRVDECIDTLKAIDIERKVQWSPGQFSDPSSYALELDTRQRQTALDLASDGADWVLQVDADEVIPHWPTYADRLGRVGALGLRALWFPQRVLRARIGRNWFFEEATRYYGTGRGHPGPTAVRPGARLLVARQDESERLLLDFGRGALDVPKQKAIVHLSWIRHHEDMFSKSRWSGHASDFDWSGPLNHWLVAHARPTAFLRMTARRHPVVRWRPAFIPGIWDDRFVGASARSDFRNVERALRSTPPRSGPCARSHREPPGLE